MKALIVDDDLKTAKLFQACIESIPGLEVATCHNAGAMREMIENQPAFDVLILDKNLPDTEGIDLLRELRGIDSYEFTPIVMITADDSRSTRVDALESGATDFLTKPIDTSELIARMKNMVNLREYHLMLTSANENLEKLATTDPLTEVWNRRSFMDRLQMEMQRAYRFEQDLTVAMLDADHFKRVNDTHGHAVGDQVLVGIAKAARARLRDIDVLGRLGGEEFALCLAQTPMEGGRVVAERIRQDIQKLKFTSGNEEFGVSVSIGLAQWTRGESASDALDRADKALYEAKEAGRNRVVAG